MAVCTAAANSIDIAGALTTLHVIRSWLVATFRVVRECSRRDRPESVPLSTARSPFQRAPFFECARVGMSVAIPTKKSCPRAAVLAVASLPPAPRPRFSTYFPRPATPRPALIAPPPVKRIVAAVDFAPCSSHLPTSSIVYSSCTCCPFLGVARGRPSPALVTIHHPTTGARTPASRPRASATSSSSPS